MKKNSRGAGKGTLASIADELGISRTTVSNAYNRPDQLSKELREKILSTARAMGYSGPDPVARSLRTRRSGSVGILLTEALTYAFEDQASLEFVSGVSRACSDMNSTMLLIPAGVSSDAPRPRAAQLVNQSSVDGFIVYSVAADDPYLEAVMDRGLPTVICDQPSTEPRAHFVGIDDREAIKPAARAVVDAGHTHIGILCIRLDREANNGPVSPERLDRAQMDVQRNRVNGILDVIRGAGITHHIPIVERHINNPQTAQEAARELLTTNPKLTAVVCTTDSMALGVLAHARAVGLEIPQDLTVTGFDGIPQALNEGLTTIRQPSQLKGETACKRLKDLIRAESAEQHTVLATEFVSGSSVAAPRQR